MTVLWRKQVRRVQFVLGILGWLLLSMAVGQPNTAGIVMVGDAANAQAHLGFVADDKGHVLARIDAPEQLLFVTANDGAEYAARQVARDPNSGMALLKLTDAAEGLTPYPFAREAAEVQRKVYAVRGGETAAAARVVAGALASIQAPQDGRPQLYLHNALTGDAGLGSPLLNNCGEVVGVVVPKPGVLSRLFGGDESKRIAYAMPSAHLLAQFSNQGLNPVRASTGCLSEADKAAAARAQADEQRAKAEAEARKRVELEQQARDQAAKAAEEEQRAAAAAAAAAEAQAKLDALQREFEQKADASAEERARLEQAMEQRRQEIEAAEAQRQAAEDAKAQVQAKAAEREQQYLLWGGIATGVLILLVLMVWVLKQRSLSRERNAKAAAEASALQAQAAATAAQADLESQAAEAARLAAVPNVFFDMVDADGQRFAVRIPGASIGAEGGAVVGRSPGDSDFVINHAEVSRRHFRLFTDGRLLLIEDQGTTNGTVVDGKALGAGEETVLVDRSQVQIGDLMLDVRLEQEA